VFLSWSGERSLIFAKALRDWLPYINPEIQPWISSTDIAAGGRWSRDLEAELDAADIGIVCVTRDNQAAPWLNFEAGALAKKLNASYVVPLLLDLNPSELRSPLSQFQAKEVTPAGMLDVLKLLDELCAHRVPDIARACATWWRELQPALQPAVEAASATADVPPTPDEGTLLEEIYRIVKERLDKVSETAPAGSEPERTQVARRAKRISTFIQEARILLVNDAPHQMRQVVSLLQSLGIAVTIAASTEAALGELGGPFFDIVISDMRRGDDGSAGLTLLRAMRASSIGTPVIFTVGRYEPERGVPGGAFGITNRVDELANLVFDALERSRG